MAQVVVNRKSYDAADCEIDLLGNRPVNFKGAEYGEEQETQLNYGRGNKPIGFSEGKISPSGSFTLGMDEQVALERAAPDGDLKKIRPFTTTFTYLNEDNGIVIDQVTWKFTGNKRTFNSGDMDLSNQFTMLVLDVKFNIQL